MIVELSNDRRITSDNHQYMYCKLLHKKDKETGAVEDYWKPEMYFTTLPLLLKAIPNQMLKESEANGWKECKEVLDSTYLLIDSVFSNEG